MDYSDFNFYFVKIHHLRRIRNFLVKVQKVFAIKGLFSFFNFVAFFFEELKDKDGIIFVALSEYITYRYLMKRMKKQMTFSLPLHEYFKEEENYQKTFFKFIFYFYEQQF